MNKLTLLLRHLWLDVSDTERAIPADMVQRLSARVAASEQRHTGQIRLCVESSLPTSYVWRLGPEAPLDELIRQRAVAMFGKLRVWDTEHNNGVLIYVLLAEHAIEIMADRGLMREVGTAQWQDVVKRMASAFRENRYEEGLTLALEETSTALMAHFPRRNSTNENPNELPDTPLLQ